MKKPIILILLIAFCSQVYSQVIELPEIVLTAVNYKYLNAVDSDEAALTVKMLEEEVAKFDLKTSEFYSDEYETYYISFYIPDGKILAAYDKDGKLIRTIERYKNVKLPETVRDAIAKEYPEWAIVSDVYKVNFHKNDEIAKKQYKVRIKKGKKTLKVKLDEQGNFQ